MAWTVTLGVGSGRAILGVGVSGVDEGGGTSIGRARGISPEGATAESGMVIGAKHDEHANGWPALAAEAVWCIRQRGHRKRMGRIGTFSGILSVNLAGTALHL